MALTLLQRDICRLLAEQRIASGESYVAGGAALNEILAAPRISRDLDLFHDTVAALAATWEADRRVLTAHGFSVRVARERPTFVEAEVERGPDRILLQWVQDSAYRFFPLIRREPFGLTLHPFDLATNKVLALGAQRWRVLLEEARKAIGVLPADTAGRCVLHRDGTL